MILHLISIKSTIFWCSGVWWPFLAIIGLSSLCWPWMNFLRKDQPLVIKIKQNWAVSSNQNQREKNWQNAPLCSILKIEPDIFTKKSPTLYLSIVIDGSTEAVVSDTALIGFCCCCSSSASNSASKSGITKLWWLHLWRYFQFQVNSN